MGDSRQHFSIRKLNIGVASVLIGVSLFGAGKTVQADDIASNPAETERVTNKATHMPDVVNPQGQAVNDQAQIKTNSSNIQDTANPSTIESSLIAKIDNASAKVEYPENKGSVEQGNWFKIHVNSGNLTNVKKGDTYQVRIGQGVNLDYDPSGITTPNFDVTNNGEGTFDLNAKSNYQTANFDINVSMSYTKSLETNTTVNIPVVISHESQILKSITVPVNMAPAPVQPSEETHPVLYYRCYGNIPNTNKIAWGVYINYTRQELKNLDVTATFDGGQNIITKSINVYTPTDVSQGIDQTSYPDNTYSYDLSKNTRASSNTNSLHLDDNTIKGYSNKPIYVYFQTECPTYDQNDPGKYASDIHLSAQGITPIQITRKPTSSGNSGGSTGSNVPVSVNQTKTVTETINYLEKGTQKVLADAYSTQTSFKRTGSKDTVTGDITWNDWDQDSYDFREVTSPVITGYTADQKVVAIQTVNPDSENIVINVYYEKNAPTSVSDTKTVSETINYYYKGNSAVAHAPYTAGVTFTRTGEKDAVTGDITWNDWSNAQTFKAVTSPTITGYTPDKAEIDTQTVNVNDKDLVFNVYYTKNAPTPVTDTKTITETINYLEKGTDKVLAPAYTADVTFTRTGEKDAVTGDITWNDWSNVQIFKAVTSPNVDDYTVETPVVEKQTVNHDGKNLVINVYYTKNVSQTGPAETTPVQEFDYQTVSETVHYVYANGPKAGQTAAPDNVQNVVFTRTGTDNGSGIVWGKWNQDSYTFKNIDSPVIKDYAFDKAVVTGETVTHNSKSINVTVYYSLHVSQNGPAETTPVQTLDMDTVTETIHYVYRGSGKTAAPDNVQKVTFTRVGTDKGDGIVWGDWTPASRTFKDVDSPVIDGYTVSEKVVKGESVKAGDKNIDITVYYDKQITPDIPNVPNTPDVTPNVPTTPTPIDKPNLPNTPVTYDKQNILTGPIHNTKSIYTVIPKRGIIRSLSNHKLIKTAVPKRLAKHIQKHAEVSLPRAGEANNKSVLVFVGLAFAMISLSSLWSLRRRDN